MDLVTVKYSRRSTVLCLFSLICFVCVDFILFQNKGYREANNEFQMNILQPITSPNVNKTQYNEMGIIYNEENLVKEVKKIHDLHYIISPDDKCVKRRPQCMIIGVGKCGTSELLDFMAIHPKIVIKRRETDFDPLNNKSIDKLVQRMPCSYHDQLTAFKHSGFFHKTNPEQLHTFNKSLKMILLVREPVARLISSYQFHYFIRNPEDQQQNVSRMRSLDDVFIDKNTGNVRVNKRVYDSIYDEPLNNYLEYFTWDNLLIIESREFINHPAQVLRKVETFLGLEHLIDKQYFVYNKQKHFHCIKSLTDTMACYGSNRGRTKFKDILNVTRTKLQDFYRPHTEHFFELIGTRYDWL